MRLCICWRPEVSQELRYSDGLPLADRPSFWLSTAAVSLAVVGLGRKKRSLGPPSWDAESSGQIDSSSR